MGEPPAGRLREREMIGWFERQFRQPVGDAGAGRRPGRVRVGIGDDAAVLGSGAAHLVWTVDACVEDVHFRREWLSLEDVGWRSFHAAVSDLAAMGAIPLGVLSSLIVPADLRAADLRELGRGQAGAARSLGCPVVGGNLSRGDRLSVTITALGEASRPSLRHGARPGHELWLIGDVGLAAAGLELLSAGAERTVGPGPSHISHQACLQAWRRPRALIEQGRDLAGHASAVIDVSDGLAGDARRLAEASHVRLVIEEDWLRRALRPELGRCCADLQLEPLRVALRGGEDYALLATGESRNRPSYARRIGRVTRGRGAVLAPAGGVRPLPLDQGFDHFAR